MKKNPLRKKTSSSRPERIRIGVIGFGYWGPNLVRNFTAQPGCEVTGIVDSNGPSRDAAGDPKARAEAAYPNIPFFDSIEAFLGSGNFDAVAVATPPATHGEVAMRCLEAGAHVLVEKPLAPSAGESEAIVAEARRRGRIVMVDHTFVYHPAVAYLRERIHNGDLGDLLYYDSVRVNLGGFQTGSNVLWDLGPHDLSILDSFTGGLMPEQVTAVGMHHFDAGTENLCYVTLKYPGRFIAHLHLNWVAPVKLRQVMVGGSEKMAIYDDNLPAEKIKIYDKGLSVDYRSASSHDLRVSYRVGDMTAPALHGTEALAVMSAHFLECIREGRRPLTDGEAGLRIVRLLEAAAESLREQGAPVTPAPAYPKAA